MTLFELVMGSVLILGCLLLLAVSHAEHMAQANGPEEEPPCYPRGVAHVARHCRRAES